MRIRVAIAACAAAVIAAAPLPRAQEPKAAGTLDRIRESGRMRLGYRADARPFSYKNDAGQPAGYSIALCNKVYDEVKSALGPGNLPIEWVEVAAAQRFRAVQQGQVDLLCAADTVTIERRSQVAFSVPVFPGGLGALTRADAPARLRDVLAGRGPVLQPVWRAAAGQVLQSRSFAVVAGTTAEQWLATRMRDLEVIAGVMPVTSYDAGVRALLDRKSDVFFGERAILLDAARRQASGRDLAVVDRLFTYEPLAFALRQNDDAFRVVVDRALSRLYRSGGLGAAYASVFGEPDESVLTFFRWSALPD